MLTLSGGAGCHRPDLCRPRSTGPATEGGVHPLLRHRRRSVTRRRSDIPSVCPLARRYCSLKPEELHGVVRYVTENRYCSLKPDELHGVVHCVTENRYCWLKPEELHGVVRCVTENRYCSLKPEELHGVVR